MKKEYYLATYRTIMVGVVLLLMGIITGPGLLGRTYFNLFISFPGIILGLLNLVFIFGGIFYLKNSKKVLRARIDKKGFYFKCNSKIDAPMRTSLMAIGLRTIANLHSNMSFIPFDELQKAELINNKWLGNTINLHLKNGNIQNMDLLNVLTNSEKSEIVNIINKSIE